MGVKPKTRFCEGGREYRFVYKSCSNFLISEKCKRWIFLFSAAKSTVTSLLTRVSVRRASSVWLFMGEEWYHFSRQTFKFYEFLLQKSSTVISSSQKLYKTFEKSVFWYHNWNTPTFWCLDIRWNTLTVSLIQLFCSRQSETFYPNL